MLTLQAIAVRMEEPVEQAQTASCGSEARKRPVERCRHCPSLGLHQQRPVRRHQSEPMTTALTTTVTTAAPLNTATTARHPDCRAPHRSCPLLAVWGSHRVGRGQSTLDPRSRKLLWRSGCRIGESPSTIAATLGVSRAPVYRVLSVNADLASRAEHPVVE